MDSRSPNKSQPEELTTQLGLRTAAPAALILVLASVPGTHAFAADSVEGVEGVYRADGELADIQHVISHRGAPFGGSATTVLIFSNKDASKDDQPENHAGKGVFGDTVVVTLARAENGYEAIGSVFVHSKLKHPGISGTGLLHIENMSVKGNMLSGRIYTDPNGDLFSEPIQVNLNFHGVQP